MMKTRLDAGVPRAFEVKAIVSPRKLDPVPVGWPVSVHSLIRRPDPQIWFLKTAPKHL